ncbi:MAG: hypothetical protein RL497_1875, partial [Pseudomonadota bacterium]
MRNVAIGEHGQLVGFSHHDGHLVGIHLEKKELKLKIINSDYAVVRITFPNVARMVLRDFTESNIVDRFYMWKYQELPDLTRKHFASLLDDF